MTWEHFGKVFLNYFFPNSIQLQKMFEVDNLVQGPNMPMVEYLVKSHALGKYLPIVFLNPMLKMHKYTKSLKSQLQVALALYEAKRFDDFLCVTIQAKVDINQREAENNLKWLIQVLVQGKNKANKESPWLAKDSISLTMAELQSNHCQSVM